MVGGLSGGVEVVYRYLGMGLLGRERGGALLGLVNEGCRDWFIWTSLGLNINMISFKDSTPFEIVATCWLKRFSLSIEILDTSLWSSVN